MDVLCVPAHCPGSAEECHATRRKVARALDAAMAMRHGDHGPLYGAAHCNLTVTPLGHGIPQICLRDLDGDGPVVNVRSDEEFRLRFLDANPTLAEFDLASHGLVLAGGAAAGILSRHSNYNRWIGDYDLFLVGDEFTEESVARTATALGDHIVGTLHYADLDVYRTFGCITFKLNGGFQAQIVLRQFKTIADLLSDFDLGSCQVAWDGSRVYLSELGLLAANYRMNVVNLAVRGEVTEGRIIRYMRRGYGLVLPELGDPSYPLGLVKFDELGGTCLCRMFATSGSPTSGSPTGGSPTLYHETVYNGIDKVLQTSLDNLARGKVGGIAAGAEYTRGLDARTVVLRITAEVQTMIQTMITPDYIYPKELIAIVGARSVREIVDEVVSTGRISTETLCRICAERDKELASCIPFRIRGVADRRKFTVSAAEWYGKTWVYAE